MTVTLPVWLMIVAGCLMCWLACSFAIGNPDRGGDYDFGCLGGVLHVLNTFFWTVAALGGVILCLSLGAP